MVKVRNVNDKLTNRLWTDFSFLSYVGFKLGYERFRVDILECDEFSFGWISSQADVKLHFAAIYSLQ